MCSYALFLPCYCSEDCYAPFVQDSIYLWHGQFTKIPSIQAQQIYLCFSHSYLFNCGINSFMGQRVYLATELFHSDMFYYLDSKSLYFRTLTWRPHPLPALATLVNWLCKSLLLSAEIMVSSAYRILLKKLTLMLIQCTG